MDIGAGEGTWVNLAELSETPGPFTMSYGFELKVLCESIQRTGVLNPPLVSRNEKGKWDVVCGYRRISALKALGKDKVFCKDVGAVLPLPLERLLANLYDNVATRKFNNVEKAMVLERLLKYLPREQVLSAFMPLLSLPCHQGTLELYLKLAALEENIRQATAKEDISMSTLKALVEVDEDSRKFLFSILSLLRLNFNQQVKFIEYINDIVLREGIPAADVFSGRSFLEILENPKTNTPQKAAAVLDLLRTRRYPRLASAQRAVQNRVAALRLPPGVVLHYDPSLEAPKYRLEIFFKNGKELVRLISRLRELDGLKTIPQFWEEHDPQN